MSADVWFKRDIANALLASYQAARATSYAVGSSDTARTAVFHAGYRSAVSTMALFFGISPAMVLPEDTRPADTIPAQIEGERGL